MSWDLSSEEVICNSLKASKLPYLHFLKRSKQRAKYRVIGNAVPPLLGEAIAKSIHLLMGRDE